MNTGQAAQLIEELRVIRQRSGVLLEDIAMDLECSRPQLSNMFWNRFGVSLEKFVKTANYLGYDVILRKH